MVCFCAVVVVVTGSGRGRILIFAARAFRRGRHNTFVHRAIDGVAHTGAIILALVVGGVVIPVGAGDTWRGFVEATSQSPTSIACTRVFVVAGDDVQDAVAIVVHPVTDVRPGCGGVAFTEPIYRAHTFAFAGAEDIALKATCGDRTRDRRFGAGTDPSFENALRGKRPFDCYSLFASKVVGTVFIFSAGCSAERRDGSVLQAFVLESSIFAVPFIYAWATELLMTRVGLARSLIWALVHVENSSPIGFAGSTGI